nr:hypothetical protein CFP56_66121 [Quercus suber]
MRCRVDWKQGKTRPDISRMKADPEHLQAWYCENFSMGPKSLLELSKKHWCVMEARISSICLPHCRVLELDLYTMLALAYSPFNAILMIVVAQTEAKSSHKNSAIGPVSFVISFSFSLSLLPDLLELVKHRFHLESHSATSARMVPMSSSGLLALATALVSLVNAHHYEPTWNLATFKETDCNPNATIGPPLTLTHGACHAWDSSKRWSSIGPIWALRQHKNDKNDPYKGKKKGNEPDPDLENKFEMGSCQLSTYSEKGCKGPFLEAIRGDILTAHFEWCLEVDDEVSSMRVDCQEKDDGEW